MAEVYWGAYLIEAGRPVAVNLHGTEQVCSPLNVDTLGAEWTAAGTGWQTYQEQLQQSCGASVKEDIDPFPHALDILMIGAGVLERGGGVTAESALPVYLRDNVALTEEQRRQR